MTTAATSAEPLSILLTLAEDQARAFAAGAIRLHLRRGEILVRQGDPSDAFYLVLSGRFIVRLEGAAAPIAEVGQGQPLGEIGFFADLPRTATVVALRDSSVLAFTREHFQKVSDGLPGFRDAVIAALARRLAERVGQVTTAPGVIRTVAILAAGGSGPTQRFVDSLREVAGADNSIFLTEQEIAALLGHPPPSGVALSNWLNALERDADTIFFVADQGLTDWTKTCLRQCDLLLLVAESSASPDLNPSEIFAFAVEPPAARRLVLLHERRTPVVQGTGAWLKSRDVLMHHHVALQDAADVERLLRFLSGKAVGFVAAGGGALGSAHVGVYRAFREAGADFDMLGGTSSGAAITAAIATGLDPDEVDDGIHSTLVKGRAFRRPTLPRYALLDHKALDRALRAAYGDVEIEDLWKPFFAVSTNLSNHLPMIHRRGSLWRAVRASGSLPGVLPPYFTSDGEMLVDGALVDNVPLAPMKALKEGPNVVVLLGDNAPARYAVEYDSIPGARDLLTAMLNPFARRKLPQIPNIVQVIVRSMLANRRIDLPVGAGDVIVRPQIPAGVGLMSWGRHREISRHAYQWTAAWIASRRLEKDPAIATVLQ